MSMLESPEFGGMVITLDILAKDNDGNMYNIGVQRDLEGADARIARFHSSAVNSRMLG